MARTLSYDIDAPKGAAEADGTDGLIKEVRLQIGKGADLIKIYADYRWGPIWKLPPLLHWRN